MEKEPVEEENEEEAEEENPAQVVAQTEGEEYIEISVAQIEDLNLTDMRAFITSPPPRGKMVQCTIIRDKSKIGKKFSPKYHVYLSNSQNYLMTGKKKGVKLSSSYYIGFEKNNFKKGASHLVAKVKSNFWGTAFHAYDMGKNPKKTKAINEMRCELAAINYVGRANFRKRIGSG